MTRIQSSPFVTFTPHSPSESCSASTSSGRVFLTVTSPRVIAPASSSVPVAMRSGMISYSTPCSSGTPVMRIVSPPWPAMRAPIATRKFARSTTSGSIAALWITVSPCAVTAASIAFFVAPTEGMRNDTSPPRSRPLRELAIR